MNKRIYYIDSRQRISGGTHSDFQYKIDLPSTGQSSAKGLAVVCLSAVIPRSYYLVVSGRNTLQLVENGGAPVTVTITPGNYSASTFKNALMVLLNAASPNHWVYTV